MSTVGSAAWLAEQSGAGAPHSGDPATIDVTVADAPDGPLAYHVVLEAGAAPRFESGAAPDEAQATLEMTWADASGGDEVRWDAVVPYMRGTAKTKGATRPLYDLFLAMHRGASG